MGAGYGGEVRVAGFDVDCFGFEAGFAEFSGYSFDEDAEFFLELFAIGGRGALIPVQAGHVVMLVHEHRP